MNSIEVFVEIGKKKAFAGAVAWPGWSRSGRDEQKEPAAELGRMRQSILDALDNAVHGDLPEKGPRGGVIWPPRYFVRRVAWHVLDHAWEIEDRIV
ncbi:MAG: hypothetical protein GWP17_06910 [Aquificales bacterium]|nr:hypothetical protein [Aquificales bacterium]